ncbi:MAG: hypothetical protein F4X76_01795 [Chloroflexi bacterium]|nr:hypothetical protein [Chloroflexota bacterium]
MPSPPPAPVVPAARRLARRWLPRRLRAGLARLRRELRDRRGSLAFADAHGSPDDFPYRFEGYRLPLLIYPGQEHLAEGKRHNQRLMAAALDGARVEPGEVLSLWRRSGRPSARRGYLEGAAIVDGRLTAEAGGAVCLLSTVLYNAGLLAALEVVERHAHSVDSYGEARYFEIGRDAAIEYGVLDLRFRNPHPFPVLLEITSDDCEVAATFRAPEPALPGVAIEVEPPSREPGLLSARTLRRVTPPGAAARLDDLGWSRYRVADASHFTATTAS